jgi:hypothetical protein
MGIEASDIPNLPLSSQPAADWQSKRSAGHAEQTKPSKATNLTRSDRNSVYRQPIAVRQSQREGRRDVSQQSSIRVASGSFVHRLGDQPQDDREFDFYADSDARTTLIVHRTLTDVSRRKRNVVVSGLPEDDSEEGLDDFSAFQELCAASIPFDVDLSEGSCVRIGKQPQSGAPRRLLVRLRSEETAAALLSAAPLLRQSGDKFIESNIFFNPDLSPAAAKVAYEQRKMRREAREQRRRREFEAATENESAPSRSTAPTHESPSTKNSQSELKSSAAEFVPGAATAVVTSAAAGAAALAVADATAAKSNAPSPTDTLSNQPTPPPTAPAGSSTSG